MEPSSTDQLTADLYALLRRSRREESYLPLHTLAELLAEALAPGEHLLLADLLVQYEHRRLAAEVGSF
jgi:hypothetical protein